MYYPLLPVSSDKDDPAVYGDFAMLERSSAAKRVRDSMIRHPTSNLSFLLLVGKANAILNFQ